MKEVLKEMMETAKVSAKMAAKEAVEEALKAQESQSDSSQKDPSDTNASAAPVAAPAPPEDPKESAINSATVEKLEASVNQLTKIVENQSEEIGRLTQKQVVASRREQMLAVGFSPEQTEKRIGAITDLTEAEFKERLADYVQLFNELNLRPAASASATDKDEGDDGQEDQPADNVDASENKDDKDDDDDVIINMDELTNVDADVNDEGGSATASGDELEEKYFNAFSRRLAPRNKRWRKVVAASKDEEGAE